jgi:uncharacterized protein YndB with AHSA1/START domain
MTPTPDGRVVPAATGLDLILTRSFRAGIDDVWASITEPERTARWFGPWEGEAGPGKTVRLTPAFEEGAEPDDVEIIECEPPRRLVTELSFTHHLADGTSAEDVGPGWEYYLDKLVASRDDSPQPEWDDYYPAQKQYYARESEAARATERS